MYWKWFMILLAVSIAACSKPSTPSRAGAKPAAAGPGSAASPLDPAMFAIGQVAPDIVGNDLDGVEFKLSDYRGKVVVLDFWGDW